MDIEITPIDKSINGKIEISGAKNSAVAIIPGCLLTNEEVILNNIPDILDVNIILEIMSELGHFVKRDKNKVTIKRNDDASWIFDKKIDKLRGSYYFIGVYLAYFRKIAFKSCGGCDLGNRPTNYHFSSFLKLGAKFKVVNDLHIYETSGLIGSTIFLPKPSVGATINILLASSLCKGETTIINAAKEPEIVDVGNFLNSMGANIIGLGTSVIKINGVLSLHSTNYTIIGDRIEAGTYLTLATIKKNSSITVTNINPNHLTSFTNVLTKMGYNVTIEKNSITVNNNFQSKKNIFKEITVSSDYFPNFPTDLGPIITIPMSLYNGTSFFIENIFDNRFSHVSELNNMGAKITIYNNKLIIFGNTHYKGGIVSAHDLRCAASLLLASIASENKTIIKNIDHLLRGYENPIEKLHNIDINIRKLDT